MAKRIWTVLMLLTVLFGLGAARADREVRLPESKYRIMVPDGMEYDGPGEGEDDAAFALVSTELGLDISFFRFENPNGASLQAIAEGLAESIDNTEIRSFGGMEMIVFQGTDPADPPETAMKCISYVFLDGDAVQMVSFWYANQEAADLTAQIITSITYGE